jgi:drug/metabolite transporter (DMT)-like permease
VAHSLRYALIAIALWATLATLGAALARVPPLFVTGIALLVGSTVTWPRALRDRRAWAVSPRTLALGIYGLFGYHFLFFLALQRAPQVEANLVNYLWPLLMVVLAPVLLHGVQRRPLHLVAALLGLAGAAIAILAGRGTASPPPASSLGFLAALAAAFIWASYSLWTQRVAPFPTTAIGLFGLLSGLLSLACHALLEPSVAPTPREWLLLALAGLGPLGAAFLCWDQALKRGDARQIGILAYLTPLLSTSLLLFVSGRPWSWSIALSAGLIVSAALLGARAR